MLFVAFAVWVGFEFEQAISYRPLSIQLQTRETDGSLSAKTETDSTLESNESARSARPIEEEKATPTEITSDNSNDDAMAAAQKFKADSGPAAAEASPLLDAPNDQQVSIETSTEPDASSPDKTEVLTTVRPGEPIVQPARDEPVKPAVSKVSMSPRQQRMINRKVEKWAENLYEMEQSEQEQVWQHKGQQYTARIKRLPTRDNMDIEQIIVEISTEQDGGTMSTEMRMKRLAFSNFTQFVNRWDPDVRVHDDEMDGRFHSNTEISLLATGNVAPTFHGKVTTASRQINMGSTRGRTMRGKVFLGGLETGVKEIVLPKHFVPFPEGTVNDNQIQHFNEDTSIRFFSDGTYSWRQTGTSSRERQGVIGARTAYLIGARKKTLSVRGIVKGRVLIYSPEKIVIEDDLVYAHEPGEPDADNYLGLVSDKNIEIAEPDVTGPGDLSIHAAMYAKRRFVVDRFRAMENALLYVYGSLTAGSLSATEPRFRTKIQFDKRLETRRPPGYPVTNRYEVASWDAEWRPD